MKGLFSGLRVSTDLNAKIKESIKLFGGKTLDEVGFELGLDSNDVKFVSQPNPKGGADILLLKVRVNGRDFYVPLSNNFRNPEIQKAISNPDWWLSCEFRAGYLAVREADGTKKTRKGANGQDTPVLADGTNGTEIKPYLSFGKPAGIDYSKAVEMGGFEPMTEDQVAALNMGYKNGVIPENVGA